MEEIVTIQDLIDIVTSNRVMRGNETLYETAATALEDCIKDSYPGCFEECKE